jgi:peptide/nickel transport system permease protein
MEADQSTEVRSTEVSGPFSRVFKYTVFRGITLLFAVVIGVYLTIFIASRGSVIEGLKGDNLGGWLSHIWRPSGVTGAGTEERYEDILAEQTALAEAEGVEKVWVFVRYNFDLVYQGLTLDLGSPANIWSYSGDSVNNTVRSLIADSLPRTLLLFGSSNLILFLISVWAALRISQKYDSFWDRIIAFLSPLSAIPGWIYGLVFSVIAIRYFDFNSRGMISSWPSEFQIEFLFFFVKRFSLPVLALVVSKIFQSIYSWRTFFMINSNEDYIALGEAKGIPNRWLVRRYLLRPTLPAIVTRFSMMIVSIWQEAIVLELFFSVAGIGHLFYRALEQRDMPLIVGLTVVFSYLLVISVFFLDFIYAVVDPRVRLGTEGRLAETRRTFFRRQVRKIRSWFSPRKLGKRSTLRKEKSPLANRLKELIFNIWWGVSGTTELAWTNLKQLTRYKTAVAGMVIISILVGISIYTVITIPYEEAVALWRGEGGIWMDNPQKARPAWINFFVSEDYPETIILNSQDGSARKEVTINEDGLPVVDLYYSFDFPYIRIPQEIVMNIYPEYEEKRPFISFTWTTPDGREIDLGSYSSFSANTFNFSRYNKLEQGLIGEKPQEFLFMDPNSEEGEAMPGSYELHVNGRFFEEGSDLDAKLVVYGEVFGLAGTDFRRRDLTIALLWGTPVALAFGFLAAICSSLLSMTIAAIGAWYRGWVDGLIQRLVEINMVLPAFPVSLMVYNFYSKRIWVILGVTVLLSIFGGAIKTYRSVFIQIRESLYIESARAYGVKNFRVIFRYLIPRVISILIPQVVILIPSYVFLETTLAYLNMSDPYLPTWGKVLRDSLNSGALSGDTYLLTTPMALLMLTAFGFLFVALALERIFDPRLQDM